MTRHRPHPLIGLALGLLALLPLGAAEAASRENAQKLLAIQQSTFDAVARNLVENPVRQMLSSAETVLRARVPAEKREAAARQVQDAARKYVDETLPVARRRTADLAQQILLPQIEQKFSDEEIRQIVAFYESPVAKKLQAQLPDLNKALAERLVQDMRGEIQERIKLLVQQMSAVLEPNIAAPAAAASAASAAPAASAGKAQP